MWSTIYFRKQHSKVGLGLRNPLPLIPTSELEFFAKAVNVKITFERDGDGNITTMTLSQEGQQIRAERA